MAQNLSIKDRIRLLVINRAMSLAHVFSFREQITSSQSHVMHARPCFVVLYKNAAFLAEKTEKRKKQQFKTILILI